MPQTNGAFDTANAGLYVAGILATAKDVLSGGNKLAHVGGEILIPVQWTLDLNNPEVSKEHVWLNTAVNAAAFIPIIDVVTIPGAVV